MTWLAGTPQAVVKAHLDMIDRIKAEESMSRAVETAIGTHALVGVSRDGKKRTGWCAAAWRRWDLRSRAGRRTAKPARAGDLRGLGIGVRVVKAND